MEELKLLIEMVATLPQMALWVLVGFFVYKVVVIGSIYGVLRLLIVKMHSWLTDGKKFVLHGKPIGEEVGINLNIQLGRLVTGPYAYWHSTDVEKLRKAIDLVEAQK